MNDDALDPKLYRKIIDAWIRGVPLEEDKPKEIEVCKHVWVWYQGFLRDGYICTICNKSQDSLPDNGVITFWGEIDWP